jgi:hypothetical protein
VGTNDGRISLARELPGRLFESYFAYLVNVVAHAVAVAVFGRASIVPPVFGGGSLRESLATLVTEELSLCTRIEVEFEFEFCTEGSLAVTTDVGHTLEFGVITYRYSGTFTLVGSGYSAGRRPLESEYGVGVTPSSAPARSGSSR